MKQERTDIWDLLAVIRFTLAMIVVSAHLTQLHVPNPFFDTLNKFGGFTAVIAFLVISGFSIAHSIARRQDRFYRRRLLRIYPLYAIAVLCTIPVDHLLQQATPHAMHGVIGNLLFLQGFHYYTVNNNPVLWTLGVEVAFYALTPLLNRLRLGALTGLIAISAAAYLAYPSLNLPYYAQLLHGLPMLCLGWAWLAGFTYYRVRDRFIAGPLLAAFVVVLTNLNRMYFDPLYQITLIVTVTAIVIGSHIRLWNAIRPLFAFLGDLSYPLYVAHAPLILAYYFYYHGKNHWLICSLILLVAAALLGLDHAIKKPAARLFDWIVEALLPLWQFISRRFQPPVSEDAQHLPGRRFAIVMVSWFFRPMDSSRRG